MNLAVQIMEDQARKDLKLILKNIDDLHEISRDLGVMTVREILDNIKARCTRNGELDEDLYVKSISIFTGVNERLQHAFLGLAVTGAIALAERENVREE